MVLTQKDACELFELAKSQGLFLMEAMWTRFVPSMQKALSWIKDGKIGKIQALSGVIAFKCDQYPESRLMNPALAGGADFIDAIGAYFELAFNILGMNSTVATVLYVILVLLCIHIIAFIIGCLIDWIAYAGKKSSTSKLAAILYLIGTISFPVYLFFGLPITIVGFMGSGKQKKTNNTTTAI